VNEAVEYGVSDGGVSDGLMPLIDGELAGDDGGCLAVSILEGFEQVAAFLGVQDRLDDG